MAKESTKSLLRQLGYGCGALILFSAACGLAWPADTQAWAGFPFNAAYWAGVLGICLFLVLAFFIGNSLNHEGESRAEADEHADEHADDDDMQTE